MNILIVSMNWNIFHLFIVIPQHVPFEVPGDPYLLIIFEATCPLWGADRIERQELPAWLRDHVPDQINS